VIQPRHIRCPRFAAAVSLRNNGMGCNSGMEARELRVCAGDRRLLQFFDVAQPALAT
jgi:hypothetical protein